MTKATLKNFTDIRAGDIISHGGQFNNLAWVYNVIYHDKKPVSLEILPITRSAQKDDDQEIPYGALKAIGLNTRDRKYFVGLDSTLYSPAATEFFAAYPNAGKTNFGLHLFRQVDDKKLDALRAESAIIPAVKISTTSKPTHVKDGQKSTGKKILDISLNDAVDIGILAEESAVATILENAGIKRLGTAKALATNDNFDKFRQIYDATPTAPISFSQFYEDVRAAWEELTHRYQNDDASLNEENAWYTGKENLKFPFRPMHHDISIVDAASEETPYFSCIYTPEILMDANISSLRQAFDSVSAGAKKEAKKDLNKAARKAGVSPDVIAEDIQLAWTDFERNIKEQPFDFPDGIRVLFPSRAP